MVRAGAQAEFTNTLSKKTTINQREGLSCDTIHTHTSNMVKGGAGRGGAGRGTKPGIGHSKARKSADTAGVLKRSGKLGACKDMEEKMFVLSVNN